MSVAHVGTPACARVCMYAPVHEHFRQSKETTIRAYSASSTSHVETEDANQSPSRASFKFKWKWNTFIDTLIRTYDVKMMFIKQSD